MDPENIVEKAQKKEEELEHMLEELLQELEDKSDILYSRRRRGQVTRIIDWMLMHDYVDDADVVDPNDNEALDDDESCDDDIRSRASSSDDEMALDDDESCDDDIRSRPSSSDDEMALDDDESCDVVYDESSYVGIRPSHDVISSNDHIGLLRKAFGYLAESIRGSGGEHPRASHLFYPMDNVHISHHGPHYVKWENVTRIGRPAFSPMQLCKSSNDMMMESGARNVMSLLYSRCSILPLIRNGSDEHSDVGPNTFRDKYVLVCCINVPAPYDLRGMQSLFNLCHELASLERSDVEIVMVARIHFLCDAPQLFKHVFKGLPSSCIVVPYDDWEQRERIYKQLGFGHEELQCFVYNRDGMFLKSFCADGYENPYGAEAFPFTKERVEIVHTERVALRQEGSLEALLRPSYEYHRPEDVVVYKLNQTHGPMWPISQVMGNKHVGLYVCCRGDLIPRLHELHKQCQIMNQDFEIVVLYIPLLYKMDPQIFKEEMDKLLQEEQVRGWWCLPFNNSVSLRFWGLTKDYDIGESRFREDVEDKLIIVGRDGKILDMYGAEVINIHGIYGTYPFTKAAVAEKTKRELLSKHRLLKSLSPAQLFRGCNPDDVISGKSLLHKKVIIYWGIALEHEANGIKYDFQRLVSQYMQMKNDVGDEFEVVFVEFPVDAPGYRGASDAKVFSEMPWYIHCPLDGTYTTLSNKLLDFVAEAEALVGFGEDGLIRSIKPLEKLDMTEGLCLEDTLFEDLHLFHLFDEFCDI